MNIMIFFYCNLLKKHFKFPIVAKPINEGSSIGVKIIKNIKDLKFEVKNLLKKYEHIMIEEFIPGQEIQVAVLNNKALGAIELKPKESFMIIKRSIISLQKRNILCQLILIRKVI